MQVNGLRALWKVCLFFLLSGLAFACSEDDIECGDENNPCDEIVIEDIINPFQSGGGNGVEDLLNFNQSEGDPDTDTTGIVIEDIINP